MIRRRRRSKKRESDAIVSFILVGIFFVIVAFIYQMIVGVAHAIMDFLGTTSGKIISSIGILVLIGIFSKKFRDYRIRNEKRVDELASEIRLANERTRNINQILPSTDRDDYFIEGNDYRRGNPKENFYKKAFSLRLIETFNNSCAKCGSKENGIDIDHFLFSKNEGGCFIMRHRDGHLVNNAIPLCQTCNRSKSDNSYKIFFGDAELIFILEKNASMTKLLNEHPILCEQGKPLKQKKVANG